MRISEHFKLNKSQFELDFVDIDLDRDTPLFLNPHLIGHSKSDTAIRMNNTIYDFFKTLITYLRANKISEAQEHFDYLHEPNETLLGLSRGKPQGKGIGKTDTKNIFKSLKDSIAVKAGLVERLEDSRIFVEGIGKDKLSDMTTNIIRKHLINYTQEQCKLWNITMRTNVLSGCYWNVIDRKWESEYTEMLLIKNKKILLVPKSIVSFSEGYTEQEYTQHFVLNFLQSEHLKLNSALVQVRKNGEKYVTKKVLGKILDR